MVERLPQRRSACSHTRCTRSVVHRGEGARCGQCTMCGPAEGLLVEIGFGDDSDVHGEQARLVLQQDVAAVDAADVPAVVRQMDRLLGSRWMIIWVIDR